MPNGKILSQAVKDTLLRYQNSELKDVRTWKRGVLPPAPTFPACAIMPERVRLFYERNGQITLVWEFNIEFFARHTDPRVAIETAQTLAQNAKTVLKQHFKLDGVPGDLSSTLVVDTELRPIYQEAVPQPSGQYMHMAVVPIEITQYEDLPEDRIVEELAGYTDSVELIQFMENRLEAFARDAGALSLRSVVQFSRSIIPPIPKYPAVTINEVLTKHDRSLTGTDVVSHSFDFSVFTDLLPQEVNLDLNFTLVDILVKVIQLNHAWGGRAEQTTVDEVEFVREINQIGRVYRSTITSTVGCREQISLAEARR